jgi:DNA recombination protein RmuC
MTEYIIIGLVLIAIILLVILIFKSNQKNTNQPAIKDEFQQFDKEMKIYFQKEYGDLRLAVSQLLSESSKTSQSDLSGFKDNMIQFIDKKMQEINQKVEFRLDEGFEKTKSTFTNVIERLSKIDEAQKKIESLSSEVVSLNDLLTDKKTRGIFGEVQLYQLLSAVLGENKDLYEKQKTLPNGFIVDAIVYAPDPVGKVSIDSKFPLDNYKRMVDKNLSSSDRKIHEKDFKNDIKKHINDIKTKYIIDGFTGDQAFMFVPAEAIFAEITAYHEDLIEYANKNKVWLVSPTTLISTLSMIQMVVKNLERDKQAKIIIEELNKLGEEFRRYSDRWEKLNKTIISLSNTAKDVNVTTQKLTNKFKSISEAKFDYLDQTEIEEIIDIEEDTLD